MQKKVLHILKILAEIQMLDDVCYEGLSISKDGDFELHLKKSERSQILV